MPSSMYRGEVRPRRQATRHHVETYAAAHHTQQPDDPFPPLSSKQFPSMYTRDPIKSQYRSYMRSKSPTKGRYT